MDFKLIRPVMDAPKFRRDDIELKNIRIAMIANDLGGVCWVRNALRRDAEVIIEPKPISEYWLNIYNNLFRKW